MKLLVFDQNGPGRRAVRKVQAPLRGFRKPAKVVKIGWSHQAIMAVYRMDLRQHKVGGGMGMAFPKTRQL